jgi:enoyl-CoA hydratase
MIESFANILVRQEGRVGVVTVEPAPGAERAQRRADGRTGDALQAFDADPASAASSSPAARSAFAAGADIKQMANASVVDDDGQPLHRLLGRGAAIRKPVLAAVSGFCSAVAASWR